MTQLYIDGYEYPEAIGSEGSYAAYDEELDQTIEMASGRIVQEARGLVTRIDYSYVYFEGELMNSFLRTVRSRRPFEVSYLPEGSNELKTSIFLCTSYTNPVYLMSVNGVAYWTNIAFSLREVDPHD